MLPSSCAIASAAVTPSWLALCASQGGAVTSPIAQMPGTLVRHIGSVSIWPLVVFTPSASSPIFSVFGTIPTATMQWLKRCSADLPSLVLIFAATPFASAFRLSTPGRGQDRQALLLQALGELRADLRILDRDDAVEHLDHRHLGAEVGIEARELDPDRARADDQQLGRHFGRGHGVAIGPDALAVGLGERQVARPRAGGDDDVLGGELGRLAVGAGRRRACPCR